jgi:hypothetical protein
VGAYAAENLSADVRLSGKRVHTQWFVFGMAGGTVEGTAMPNLAPEQLDVQVDVSKLSLAGLEPLTAGAAALVHGQISGGVQLVSPCRPRGMRP